MTHNRLVVQHMLRTSEVIRRLKNSRVELTRAISATRIVIENGRVSHEFNKQINEILNQSSLLIKKLEHRVEELSKKLDEFDATIFDPIPFISSYDIKHKAIDLVKGTNYVGFLDITTGEINILSEEKTDAQIEQQSAKQELQTAFASNVIASPKTLLFKQEEEC